MKTRCRQTNTKKNKEPRGSACSSASSGCFPTPRKVWLERPQGSLASACPRGDPVMNPSLPCPTAEKLLEQRSRHPGGRKETKSRPPEATAASPPRPVVPPTPTPPASGPGAPARQPGPSGPRGAVGSVGRGGAAPRPAGPSFVQAREQRAFTGCNPGPGAGGQVHTEGKRQPRGLAGTGGRFRPLPGRWQPLKALFVRPVGRGGPPLRGVRSCGPIAGRGLSLGGGPGPPWGLSAIVSHPRVKGNETQAVS